MYECLLWHPLQPMRFGRSGCFAVAALLGAASWCAPQAARAQAASDFQPATARIEALDVVQAGQERLKKMLAGKSQTYEDRVMDPSSLPALPDPDAPADAGEAGFASWLSETRFGAASADAADSGLALRSARELGQRIEYRRETLNYGDYSLQMDARASSGTDGIGPLGYATRRASQRLTLRNQGLPVSGALRADSALGDITSELTDALTRTYRLSLGYSAVRGASTRLYGSDFDLRAGVGERGLMTGGPFPGFERGTGSLGWAGYTQRLSPSTYAGVQLAQASGVADVNYGIGTPAAAGAGLLTVRSVAAAFGYGHDLAQDGDLRSRVTLVGSRSSGASDAVDAAPSGAQGLFLEAGWRSGRYRHEFGAYTADPDLRFGDYTLANDNRGAYWRVDHSAARLTWGTALDYEQQNPSHDPTRFGADRIALSGNAQYRIDAHSAIGGNVTASHTRYTNAPGSSYGSLDGGYRSLSASGYYRTRIGDWGSSRFSALLHRNETLVANDVAATGEELQWEHDWITGRYETMRPEFTTTLGWARDRSAGLTQRYPTAGLVTRQWLDADWSLGGSLRYTARSGNLSTSRGLAGTLTTERQLGSGWRLGASASLNQAMVRVAGTPVSSASSISSFTLPQVERSRERSVYVYLRWEGSGGIAYQSLGLRDPLAPGAAGGGRISGTVFFDADRDGQRQASETGVPQVEVVLDGRQRTLTDSAGHFEFPLAATGHHHLTLRPESVPLPWGAASNAGVSADLPLRGEATVAIPVMRVSD